MKLKLPKVIENIKIDIERWNYRRKFKSGTKVDLEKQLKAIEKAEILSKKRKIRLWVVRLMPGEYKVLAKGELKGALNILGLKHRLDIHQLNDVIVHITK
jgi:hypothetical protein